MEKELAHTLGKMRGGVILGPPPGTVNHSLVLNDGQVYNSNPGLEANNSFNGKDGAPIFIEDAEAAKQRSGAVSWGVTLLILAAAALSVWDTYYLSVAMQCLLLPVNSQRLAIGLSIVSAVLGFYSFIAKFFVTNPEKEDAQSASCRRRYNICIRNSGQIGEDLSIIFALIPQMYALSLRQSDYVTKLIAAISFAATILSLREEPHGAYFGRKVCSIIVLMAAVALFIFSFLSSERDKSLVIYNFSDAQINQTLRLAMQEDQIAFDNTKNCAILEGNSCVPCITSATYGRGNNTWFPQANDTGQCAGVALAVDEAFDCDDQGRRSPLSVSIFVEDTCSMLVNNTCLLSTYAPLVLPPN